MDHYKVEAARIFGVPYEAVTAEQRRFAKLGMYWSMYA